MWFLTQIVGELYDISDWFYDAYQEVRDWVWPFYLLKYPLYSLYTSFNFVAYSFGYFNDWLDWADDKLDDIMGWSTIRSYIRSWLPDLEDAIYWWDRWWVWVGNEIDDWWASQKNTVKGWIAIATQPLDDLLTEWYTFWNYTFPSWMSRLNTLRVAWDNFWTVTFPNLISFNWLGIWWDTKWQEIDTLINSKLLEWSPFLEGWQEWRDSVVEFFSDPLEWLLGKFTDWFLGKEE